MKKGVIIICILLVFLTGCQWYVDNYSWTDTCPKQVTCMRGEAPTYHTDDNGCIIKKCFIVEEKEQVNKTL